MLRKLEEQTTPAAMAKEHLPIAHIIHSIIKKARRSNTYNVVTQTSAKNLTKFASSQPVWGFDCDTEDAKNISRSSPFQFWTVSDTIDQLAPILDSGVSPISVPRLPANVQ